MSDIKVGDKVKRIEGKHKDMVVGDTDLVIAINDGVFGKIIDLLNFGKGHTIENFEVQKQKIHRHHDLIIAWLEGEQIEIYDSDNRRWIELHKVGEKGLPFFKEDREYRIQPKKSEKDLKIEELQGKMDKIKEELEELKGE